MTVSISHALIGHKPINGVFFGAKNSKTRSPPDPKDSIRKAIPAVQLVLPGPTILLALECQVRGTACAASKLKVL